MAAATAVGILTALGGLTVGAAVAVTVVLVDAGGTLAHALAAGAAFLGVEFVGVRARRRMTNPEP